MAKWGNLDGTLRSIFSIGKTNIVDLRTNAGTLQGRNNGGAWQDVLGQSSFADIEAKSANFNAANKKTYIVTASVNAQLPAPVNGMVIEFKVVGTYVITLVRNGSENIDGQAASFVSSGSENEAFKVISDGTNWFIL